jgi:Biotin/lipoate A/B protein ligase family
MRKRESEKVNLMGWASRAEMSDTAIDLPPPFRLVKLREMGDAFAYARSIAHGDGAGTLVYVGRFDVVELAVVLEPDEPLFLARRAFYAGLNALADALTVLAPPECPITVSWPDAINVNGGLVGGGRLGWPPDVQEQDTPDWVIFGASVRTICMNSDRSGLPLMPALEDQGFASLNSDCLVASFARHLMSNIDTWQSVGFDTIARNYVHRLDSQKGATPSIAASGDLHLQWRGADEPERHSLLEALRSPSWLDIDSKKKHEGAPHHST